MRVGLGAKFRNTAISNTAICLAFLSLLSADVAEAQNTGPAAAIESTATVRSRETGRIQGTATIADRLTSRRMKYRPYGDFGEGQFPASATERSEFSNVVFYLESAPVQGGPSNSPGTHSMVQKDEEFSPHVLAVSVGDEVAFPNADNIYHNVFSLSGPATFDLGRYRTGESRSVVMEHAGAVGVFCQIHSDMSATILVLDNSYFAVPDENGGFTIDGIPAGEYTLVAWHERMRPLRQQVRVLAGESTSVAIHLPDLTGGPPPESR